MALFRFNHYGSTKNKFLSDIVLVLSKRNRFSIRRCAKFVGHVRCPTVISHYATALGNLPIAVNGLPLVPIGNDIWAGGGGSGGLLKQTKSVKHDESYLPTVPWCKQTPPFLKSSQNFDPRGLGFKNFASDFWN